MTVEQLSRGIGGAGGAWLPGAETSRILVDFGIAAFVWDAATDAMSWSREAPALLGIDPADLPASGRAYLRLLDPETAAARTAAVPAFGAPGSTADVTGYTTRYRLKQDLGGQRWIEETGRWIEDPDGALRRTEGWLRAAEVAMPEDRQTGAASAQLLREELLSELQTTI